MRKMLSAKQNCQIVSTGNVVLIDWEYGDDDKQAIVLSPDAAVILRDMLIEAYPIKQQKR